MPKLTPVAQSIINANPDDIPMQDCDYYNFLKENWTGHYITDLKNYLVSKGFDKTRDSIPARTIQNIKYIGEHFFFKEIKPGLDAQLVD